MKQLTCEMCGSTDLLKQDGAFICQNCGTKYSIEEAKKMMAGGTSNVSGSNVVKKSNVMRRFSNAISRFSKRQIITAICAVVVLLGVVLFANMPKSKAALLRKAETVNLKTMFMEEAKNIVAARQAYEGKTVIITGYVGAIGTWADVCLKWHKDDEAASFPLRWGNELEMSHADTFLNVSFVNDDVAATLHEDDKIKLVGIIQNVGWHHEGIINYHDTELVNAYLID